MTVLAHGLGGRADLPVPLGVAIYGAGFAVAISFLAVVLLWRTPRLHGASAGRPLPRALESAVDSPVLRGVLRALVLSAAVLVLVVAAFGPPQTSRNLSPYALYITLWVGLIPVSLLLGPVWSVVNPLSTVHSALVRLTGPAPAADRLPTLGYWPAAVALLAFVWLELVLPGRAQPRTVAVFLLSYSAVQLIAALWFGAGWFARGDAFEVYSSLLGRLAPVGRRDDGRLVLRSPLDGVAGLPPERGLVAVALVLIGSTGFDGLSRTQFWQAGPGERAYLTAAPGTVGLLVMVAVAGLLFVGATVLAGVITGASGRAQPGLYAHTLLPIAAGYAVAHYFSLLLLDGQATWILASNPFGQDGVDLFGTYARTPDYTAVGTRTIALVQVLAIVLGHLLGVVLAHDRAVRTAAQARSGAVLSGQLPLAGVMVAFTVGGLALLLSA